MLSFFHSERRKKLISIKLATEYRFLWFLKIFEVIKRFFRFLFITHLQGFLSHQGWAYLTQSLSWRKIIYLFVDGDINDASLQMISQVGNKSIEAKWKKKNLSNLLKYSSTFTFIVKGVFFHNIFVKYTRLMDFLFQVVSKCKYYFFYLNMNLNNNGWFLFWIEETVTKVQFV